MLNPVQVLFDSAPFIPHGHCYLWNPGLVWIHVVSDALIALAYYSIPIQLLVLARKRQDLPFDWILLLFGAFIVACGTTHVMEIWTLWTPTYWLAGLLKLATAAISLYTAGTLMLLIPKLLALPSPAQLAIANQALEEQIWERQQVQQILQESEERFRSAFDFAAIGKALVSLEGRWLQVNRALCEILGYSEPELLKTTAYTLTHPDDLELGLDAVQQIIEGKQRSVQFQKRYFHKQGHVLWIQLSTSVVRDANGEPLYLISQLQDITARAHAEQALELQSLITKNMAEGIALIKSSDGSFVYTNPKFEQMFGYEAKDMNGEQDLNGNKDLNDKKVSIANFKDLPARFKHLAHQIQQMCSEQGESTCEIQNTKQDGTPLWCRVHTSTFEHPEYGWVQVAVHEDITERKQAEQAQRESERRFQAIFDQTFQFVGLLKPDGTLLEANQTILDFGGIELADIVNRPFWEARWWTISDVTQTQLQNAIAQAATGEFVRYEVEVLGAGETVATIDFSLKPLRDETGAVSLLLSEGRDISDRQRLEQIEASLAAKEVLLQEVHHRVKNNLQIISSLLSIQSKQIQDPATLEVFTESQNRVKSMALVHEKLYQSDDLAKVDFADYIHSLSAAIFRSYNFKSKTLALKLEVSPVFLNVDTAIPCGLILNELLSNSLKHGFPDNALGEILIRLDANENESFSLSVQDNGVGFPQTIDIKKSKSIGLQLISGLTKQLHGTLEMSSDQGTLCKVTFHEIKSPPRK